MFGYAVLPDLKRPSFFVSEFFNSLSKAPSFNLYFLIRPKKLDKVELEEGGGYLSDLIIASNAIGLFIAKSAKTFLLREILFDLSLNINSL